MIDIFFILFTGGMTVYVIVRAALLDRTVAWYEVAPEEKPITPTRPNRAALNRGLDHSGGNRRSRSGH
jgi:hypothetical protein